MGCPRTSFLEIRWGNGESDKFHFVESPFRSHVYTFAFSKFQEFAETPLHHAISHETGHSLHVVDFLVQNSSSLDKQTREGNTPLHYCVIQNQCESMRLLLRSGASPQVENNNGKTPVDIAKERGHHLCEEMVSFIKNFSFRGFAIFNII